MTTSQEYDCDVLICGAGPVGLVLALALRRLGVDCRIVDKSPAPAATSRAFGLQPRVLEILAALDLLPALKQAGGRTYPGTSIIRGTTALPFMTYEDMPTTQRHMMMLEQNLSERVFAEQLVERGGVEVERATEVTGIEADAHGVTVALSRRSAGDGAVYDWYAINSAMDSAMDSASSNTASNDAINSISSNSAGNSTSSNSTNNNSTNNNGASDASAASGRGKQADEQADELITVRARFLVGADGAHSTVRKRMGWRFEGHTNSDQFTLADADVVTNLADTIGPVWGMRDTLVIFDLPTQQP
ncbi:FAD/NAD(P)-binding domain-containing protein, partial [Ramicandelaber brevisporus]